MNHYDLKRELEFEDVTEKSNGAVDKDAISQRLEEIYKRLELIDAYSAEARAASILAVSSIFSCSGSFEVFSWLKLGFLSMETQSLNLRCILEQPTTLFLKFHKKSEKLKLGCLCVLNLKRKD